MTDEINFIDDGVPAYKKKSKKKGQPRADHKHIYETVLLTRHYHFNFGNSDCTTPTKVCTICGRIDKTDEDESLWEKYPDPTISWTVWRRDLSEKALNLPKWQVDDFDKFATRVEENV